jgi:hypothetical protein
MLRTFKDKLFGLRRTEKPPESSHPWMRVDANQQHVPSSFGDETPWYFRQPLLALGQQATSWLGHSRRKRALKNGEHFAMRLPFVLAGLLPGDAPPHWGLGGPGGIALSCGLLGALI